MTIADTARIVPGHIRRRLRRVEKWVVDSEKDPGNDQPPPASIDKANIVTSEIELLPGIAHAPVLDLDIPHTYVPSTTPGHGHLYLDIRLNHDKWVALMEALRDAGIIEAGYFTASIKRGYSAVRLPWIAKGQD